MPYRYSPIISEGVWFWFCIGSEDSGAPDPSMGLLASNRNQMNKKKQLSFSVLNALTFFETDYLKKATRPCVSTNTCTLKMLPVTGLNEIMSRSFSDINALMRAGTTRMMLLKKKVDCFRNA